jgi:hypothetical protein
VIALLSARYRLSRREVRQLLRDLWQVRVSLGAVVRQEQAQSAALAPVVEEAQAAVQQAAVVNMDETGWRQEQQRAWLWTAVTTMLTVFRIDRTRSRGAVDALLGPDFRGVVGSDRWSAYNRFPPGAAPYVTRTSNATSRHWWTAVGKRGRLAGGGWRRSSGSSRSGTASGPGSLIERSCNGGWCRSKRGWGDCCGAGRTTLTGKRPACAAN